MIILIDVINSLIYRGIDLNLSDLLVTHKFNSLLEILSKDIKGNIIEYDSLLGAREMLFTSFYSILFIFIGIYFFLANSRFIYINNDGIYKLGKLYRWDTNKSHQWERSFGRNILNANVIDIKGRAETIRFIFYDDDKNTLRTLLDTENFTNNEE
ncbi:MAG: hypothetical protein GX053_07565 [Tissierella sp.]|nr:hypothetical protein [Tissierella sp.]